LRSILACIAVFLIAGCVSLTPEGPGVIYGPGGVVLSEMELVAELRSAQIVALGEVHDNPTHHARQARLVRQLQPRGLAVEMVPEASEEGIQVFLAQGGMRGGIGPAIGWDRLGWPDWRLYAPIFEAAPGAYITGGGVARSDIRVAIRGGAAIAYGAGASDLRLDQPLDPVIQVAFEDDLIAAHCNLLPRQVAGDMVEAQRLRDALFGDAVLRAYLLGGAGIDGGGAVLITGNGHARTDRGAPAYLRLLAPELKVLTVGMIEMAAGPALDQAAAARDLPYDYVWISQPAERDDPCDALR
jgi:uncharacterized iron-regulated protein